MYSRALVQKAVAVGKGTTSGIACQALALCLLCKVLLRDLLVVLVDDILGHTLHAEYLDLEALATGNGIFDVGERLLVDLIHVH